MIRGTCRAVRTSACCSNYYSLRRPVRSAVCSARCRIHRASACVAAVAPRAWPGSGRRSGADDVTRTVWLGVAVTEAAGTASVSSRRSARTQSVAPGVASPTSG